mgnify:FL=1
MKNIVTKNWRNAFKKHQSVVRRLRRAVNPVIVKKEELLSWTPPWSDVYDFVHEHLRNKLDS